MGLSKLSVHGPENAIEEMFAYLLSYTGLRKLEIRKLMMDRQDLEESAGCKLWNQIIPYHRCSLTELSITPWYEGTWCYGPHAAAAILQCTTLRNLTLSVCSVDSFWAEAKLSQARDLTKVEFYDIEKIRGAAENCGVCTSFLSTLVLAKCGILCINLVFF